MNTKNLLKVFSNAHFALPLVVTVLCAIAAASYLWMLTTENGAGISPDSIDYYSTAQNFAQGKGMQLFNGQRLTIFPVGYPLFLSAFYTAFSTVSFFKWSCWLLSALLFITILLVGFAFQQVLQQKTVLFIGIMIWATCHFWLYDVFTMVWSETLFVPLSLLGIVCFYHYYQHPSYFKLMLAGMVVACCCITRFSGVAFAGSMIVMMLFHPAITLKQRILQAIFFTAICCIPVAINVWQNTQVTGHLTGIRQASDTSWWTNCGLCFHTFLNWIVPISIQANTYSNFAGSVLFLIAVYYMCRRLFTKAALSMSRHFLFAGTAYWALMLLTASISKYEPLNNRLLFPAFFPLLIGSLGELANWILPPKKAEVLFAKRGHQLLLLVISISLCSQLKEDIAFVEEVREDGIPGYTEKGLAEENGMIGYFTRPEYRKQIDQHLPIYSNSFETVYFFTGLPCRTLPEFAHLTEKQHYQALNQSHYLIWFNQHYARTAIPHPNTYKQYQSIDTIFTCSDGYALKVQ